MLITLIGLAIVVAAAIYVTWPLLMPVRSEMAVPVEPAQDELASLVHEKDSTLAAIRDADFDHSVGKLTDLDHQTLRAELEARALRAIDALDEATAHAAAQGSTADVDARRYGPGSARAPGEAGPVQYCPACSRPALEEARFCVGCGRPLGAARSAERRRA